MIGSLPPVGAYIPPTSHATQAAPAAIRGEGVGAREREVAADAKREATANPRGNSAGSSTGELSPEDLERLRWLQQRDREVRAHEMAHVAVGGNLVRKGASYSYEVGPDGQRYAIGGEVSIDTSPGRTPEETIDKAVRIKAAALAPSDPSPQDREVAAQADQMGMQARMELAAQGREERQAESSEARPEADDASPSAQRVRNAYAVTNLTPETAGSFVNFYA